MSDWLSIIIIILIVGIMLDGIRRARNSRKNELKLSKNARKVDLMFEKEDEKNLSSELPFGGARNAQENELDDDDSAESTEELISAPITDPIQEQLELDEPVPMLMETFESIEDSPETQPEPQEDPNLVIDDELTDHGEPSIGELSDLDAIEEPVKPERPAATQKSKTKLDAKSLFFSHSAEEDEDETLDAQSEEAKTEVEPEEILVVNVLTKTGERISGEALLKIFTSEKLKYGKMGIFHRHLNNDGDAPVIYSIANVVEPGNFNFAKMKESDTPGICIFLTLPCAGNAIDAYDDMIDTARVISATLGCELSDENRSILTKQAIEHGRQRVMEFERKNKLRR